MYTLIVGNALHKNPFAPLVPCHRVVRANGEIGGYAFGEQLIKRAMEEQAILDAARQENDSKFSADGETWITSSEAAKMCNVCVTTLWAWKKAGFLVPAKVGRSNRYALSDIKKLMASHGTDQSKAKLGFQPMNKAQQEQARQAANAGL